MKPTRRKTVLGLGALATGSGAVFSSAAFNSTVNSDADFRVQVSEELRVEAGNAFNDDGTVNTGNGSIDPSNYISVDDSGTNAAGDDFYGGGDLGSVFNTESPPLATVTARDEDANGNAGFSGVNENLEIYAAFASADSVTFNSILQVSNQTNESVNVGIAYNRANSQYGGDVDGSTIAHEDVQQAFQFKISGTTISPDHTHSNGDGDSAGQSWNLANDSDQPSNTVSVAPSSTVQLDLAVDVTVIGGLAEAANLDPGFGAASTTVDLLDQITVGTDNQ